MSDTDSKGGWVYNGGQQSLTREEKIVMGRGYPWVSISKVEKGICLGYHKHHSENTHLVLTGEISIYQQYLDGENPIPKSNRLLHKGGIADMKANMAYGATTTRKGGSTFVEGHKVLSPTTRNRYITRGTIVWDDEVDDHPYPVDDDVRREGNVTEEVFKEDINPMPTATSNNIQRPAGLTRSKTAALAKAEEDGSIEWKLMGLEISKSAKK
ncbi:hypothetical protein LZ554_008657 [Drepanopeziza brunnea f. sp. 'monogermtubi']|nr:hypothetical protein LZ554_008657 [Drepanopeziza brunnea f. sp. 'monogermtubi']